MVAVETAIAMAAECGGPAAIDGPEHFEMGPDQPAAASFEKVLPRGTNDIRHLHSRLTFAITGHPDPLPP